MVAALVLGLALASVDVIGETTCPSPADVRARVAEMVPVRARAPGERLRVRLARTAAGVRVERVSAAGEVLAQRDLAARDAAHDSSDVSCEDLAAAVAIVIGAWAADLDPHTRAQVRLPPAAAPARPPVPTVAVRAMEPPPRAPPQVDVGLALIASLAGGQIAPGARLAGWIAPGAWRLGVGAAVSGVTARSESVGARPDAAHWSRIAASLGPEARIDLGRTTIATRAQALAARLHVEGNGLTTTAADSTAQFGAGLGLQVGRTWGNATAWLGADVLLWPGHDRLEIAGLAEQGQLPRLELQLALGLSLGRVP